MTIECSIGDTAWICRAHQPASKAVVRRLSKTLVVVSVVSDGRYFRFNRKTNDGAGSFKGYHHLRREPHEHTNSHGE